LIHLPSAEHGPGREVRQTWTTIVRHVFISSKALWKRFCHARHREWQSFWPGQCPGLLVGAGV
jgi:hypothetical protein